MRIDSVHRSKEETVWVGSTESKKSQKNFLSPLENLPDYRIKQIQL